MRSQQDLPDAPGQNGTPKNRHQCPKGYPQLGTAAEPPHNEAAPSSNADSNLDPVPIWLPDLTQNQLFFDDDTLAQICGIAVAKEESTKKVSLPDIIPGFKASSLEIGENTILFFLLLSSKAGPIAMSDRLICHRYCHE